MNIFDLSWCEFYLYDERHKGRYERLFSKGYLHHVFQFSERLLCAKNGNFLRMREGGGSAVSYAWFVFRKERCDAPTIGWV